MRGTRMAESNRSIKFQKKLTKFSRRPLLGFESCSNRLPSSAGGGVDATSRRSSEASFKWSGRGGVVQKFLDHTTPAFGHPSSC